MPHLLYTPIYLKMKQLLPSHSPNKLIFTN